MHAEIPSAPNAVKEEGKQPVQGQEKPRAQAQAYPATQQTT